MEQKIIDLAKELYKDDLTPESMSFYLKDAGAAPEEIPAILDKAWAEFVDDRTTKYKVVNKVVFYSIVALLVLTLIIFWGVLPGMDFVIGHSFIFSALGATLVSLVAFYALSYNNTWKSPFVENHGKPNIQYGFLLFLPMPIVVMHFIFSFRFESAQNTVLKETQVETEAVVTSGSSVVLKRVLRGGQVDYTSITVMFKPENSDDSVTVTKEIPSYKLKDFYKGEKLRIIYSRNNPQNISLLSDDATIREFKQTQQRELEISDLLRLSNVDPGKLGAELDKISFGWTYDKLKNIYLNVHYQNELSQRGGRLMFVGPSLARRLFADSLAKNGFKKMSIDEPTDVFETGPISFENDKFKVDMTVLPNNRDDDGANGPGPALVIITPKK